MLWIDPEGLFYGLPDYILGTALVIFGGSALASQQYYVAIPLIGAGLWLLTDAPISKYFIERPFKNAAEKAVELQKKRLEDYDKFYREQTGQCE